MATDETPNATDATNVTPPTATQAPPPVQAPPQQQAPTPAQAPYWPPPPYQGYQPYQPYYQRPPHKPVKIIEDSNKPTVIGALLILVGILGIVMWSMGLAGTSIFGDMMDESQDGTVTIRGFVDYTNGTGVAGANVTVLGTPISTQTDAEGNFVLYAVPQGDQSIRVEKPGYTTLVRKVSTSSVMNMDWNWGTDMEPIGPKLRFTMAPGTGSTEIGSWNSDFDVDVFKTVLVVCGAVGMVMSVVAMLGGYFALKRQRFPVVVIGCLAGIFTLGFGIGTVLAFVALFVTLLASEEFKKAASSD